MRWFRSKLRAPDVYPDGSPVRSSDLFPPAGSDIPHPRYSRIWWEKYHESLTRFSGREEPEWIKVLSSYEMEEASKDWKA